MAKKKGSPFLLPIDLLLLGWINTLQYGTTWKHYWEIHKFLTLMVQTKKIIPKHLSTLDLLLVSALGGTA